MKNNIAAQVCIGILAAVAVIAVIVIGARDVHQDDQKLDRHTECVKDRLVNGNTYANDWCR